MKLTPYILGAFSAVALLATPAHAGGIEKLCIDTVTADAAAAGQTADAEATAKGCSCLAGKAKGDAEMTANIEKLAALAAAERAAHTSEATGKAIAECFPQPAE